MKFIRLYGLLLAIATPCAAFALSFDEWSEGIAVERMRADPNGSTRRQYLPQSEQDLLDRQLTPNTSEYRAGRIAAARTALAQLARFDRSTLDRQQRASAAVIEWSLKTTVDSEPFADFDFPFNQFRGLHVGLINFLSQIHPVRNRGDIENYLARLAQVATQIDNGIGQARDASTRGFLMPRFITEASLGQFARFLADSPAKNVLVASLDERAAKLQSISAEDRAKLVGSAEAIVAGSVIPAFRRAQALLQDQLSRTTADAGLWRLPGGARAYAYELRRNTTTDYSPAQIHELGRSEVIRIEKQMDGLLHQLGYHKGDIKERMARLDADSQPSEADPRPALLARFEEIMRDAERRSKDLFDVMPKAPIIVTREPPFTEKTAAAQDAGPAKDGTRPGIFWAPLPGPSFHITGMRTLAYHEGVPGHHFQIALLQETESLPRYRRDQIFTGGPAYAEGWALYSEQLAAENNWYDGDIKGRLGQLDAELFRAKRLVVDTGLHAMKWTRQQAIDYGIGAQEVERYVVLPGQACAYKIGMLRILELRGKAQKALGTKFSLKQFHNVVLQNGNLPLAVLEQVIDDWIVASK